MNATREGGGGCFPRTHHAHVMNSPGKRRGKELGAICRSAIGHNHRMSAKIGAEKMCSLMTGAKMYPTSACAHTKPSELDAEVEDGQPTKAPSPGALHIS